MSLGDTEPGGKMHRGKCMTGLSISLLGNCEITYEHRQSDVCEFCRGREEQEGEK